MPALGLSRIVLSLIRSAYVPISTKPAPQGMDAVVELAGVEKLPLFSTRLCRNIVHRWMRVETKAGVAEEFDPESQAPSWGGGRSSLLREFGPTPFELLRKVDFSMMRWPPALVPE